jgi:hypothetical protein
LLLIPSDARSNFFPRLSPSPSLHFTARLLLHCVTTSLSPNGNESDEAVEDELGGADEREAHAKPEDAPRVGDELGLGRLYLAEEAAGVGVLENESNLDLNCKIINAGIFSPL